MATKITVLERTYLASGDMSGQIYTFVKKDTSGGTVTQCDEGDLVLGVLQNKPTAAGQGAVVMLMGETPVIAGADGVTEGALVSSDGDGGAQTAESGDYIAGLCTKSGDGSTGRIATVVLFGPQGKQA